MTERTPSLRDLTSQEYRNFVLPTSIASILVLMALLINIWIEKDIPALDQSAVTFLVITTAIYITTSSIYLIPARGNKDTLIWLNAFIGGAGYWLFAIFIPDQIILYFDLLLLLGVISMSTYAGRLPTLFMIAIATTSHIISHYESINTYIGWVEHLGMPAVAVLLGEITSRILNISRGHVRRLEIINTFSRQVAAAHDRQQVFELLNSTIPNALIADSYYITTIEGDKIHVILCYDDGEYFNDVRAPAEGTLTNWVDKNQQGLFLPDLRQPIQLEGIKIILVGKDKTSLSWIGVPMKSSHFRGVLALGSYQPNAFNRGDLELLSNLARHAALAIENVDRQVELEERTRLDSLTGVYNHGYFLETLKSQAEESISTGKPLSLIMLDVDFFKLYNDTYGHLAGDKILTLLCTTIRDHIKSADPVGRWGGEEFVIALPNTTAEQALLVATRISQSMRGFSFPDRNGKSIPPPTVSQGISLFPMETDKIFNLIDIADQRLYAAKNRGRDQIEGVPTESHP
jgi:diguanylate cyclase (GGDEF)-like protein